MRLCGAVSGEKAWANIRGDVNVQSAVHIANRSRSRWQLATNQHFLFSPVPHSPGGLRAVRFQAGIPSIAARIATQTAPAAPSLIVTCQCHDKPPSRHLQLVRLIDCPD